MALTHLEQPYEPGHHAGLPLDKILAEGMMILENIHTC